MSTTQTIFANEYATLMYHPDSRIVHHIFHKPIGGESFRQVLTRGVEVLEQNGADKWLSDDRLNASVPQEDGAWGMSVWAPRAHAAGWKYWAIVVPESIAGRVNMQQFIDDNLNKGKGRLRVMVFIDPVEAQQWLENQV
ncbi:MAG: hypothetical protein JNJ61_08565 [Anaerolineae bacterium]|nr:hypothetical protein [Anaerolineae bacterium]